MSGRGLPADSQGWQLPRLFDLTLTRRLHGDEVLDADQQLELVWQMVSMNHSETLRILDDDIVRAVQVNPDCIFPVQWGPWHFRQSIDNAMTANRAILDLASRYREDLLFNFWRTGRIAIERGGQRDQDDRLVRPARTTAAGPGGRPASPLERHVHPHRDHLIHLEHPEHFAQPAHAVVLDVNRQRAAKARPLCRQPDPTRHLRRALLTV